MKLLGSLAAVFAAGAMLAMDVHLDPARVPGSCQACHRGHGASRSPMLASPQSEVCLACHGSQVERDEMVRAGLLSPTAEPQLLSSALAQSHRHPVDEEAYTRREPRVVVCTSCHSPHRSASSAPEAAFRAASVRPSPRNPGRAEFELCESCHGGAGPGNRDPMDVSGRFDPRNMSFHPVEAPARNGSPSTRPEVSGQQINCTDCHGNSEAGTPGPHGSAVRFLLRREYTTLDGQEEAASVYALCYGCHDRERVLRSSAFPEHQRHVVELSISCATCHDPHGSPESRALIRFGDGRSLSGVVESVFAGRLAFEDGGPGAGACYLTCHGYDHAPAVYGGLPTPPVEALVIDDRPVDPERPPALDRPRRSPGKNPRARSRER